MLKKLLAGATVGTLLGSLAIYLYPKRHEIMNAVLEHAGELTERAKDYAEDFIGNEAKTAALRASRRSGYMTSGLAGILLGAGISLALAPKSRRQFRTQLSNAYRRIFNKTYEMAYSSRNQTRPRHTRQTSSRHPMANGYERRKQSRLMKHK